MQSRNRGAARDCQTDHQTEIVVPGEMFLPALRARIEQWRGFTRQRIKSRDARSLALIAAATTETQIFGRSWAAEAEWDDVVSREWIA